MLVQFIFAVSVCWGTLEQRAAQPTSPVVSEVELSDGQIKFPFLGKIRGRGVNVRSGGNLNYEVLTRLQEGEVVVVLEEVYGWYKIIPPEGAYLWIHQSYLKDDQAVSDSVNVRSRPSLDSSINCQVNQGDIVETIAQEGEWIKIKPPKNAAAWVHKDYVVYEKPYDQGLKEIEEQNKARLEELRKEELLKEAKRLEQEEFYKPVDQIQIDEVIRKYQALIEEFPQDKKLYDDGQKRIENLMQRKEKLGVASKPQPLPLLDLKAVQQEPTSSALPSPNWARKEPQYDVFEGRLEAGTGFGKNKRYKLIQNRRRICILLETKPSLSLYLHKKVRVHGTTVSSVYPHVPVIKVRKVEFLPSSLD